MNSERPIIGLMVPPFVVVTYVGTDLGSDPYTVSNEVSGKHFSANAPTVAFLEALRSSGSLAAAQKAAGLPQQAAQKLLAQLMKSGVVVQPGQTNKDAAPAKTPLESRAIMIRFDLIDAAPVAERLVAFGRAIYSGWGMLLWMLLAIAAGTSVVLNADKAALTLAQVPDTGWRGLLVFALLLVGLKIVHEMGHALAYQEMCRRAAIPAGPIRMGISIFALTPFPYTNVTGAWRLAGRVPRAVIGAGGLYLEFFTVFLATLVWANIGTGLWSAAIFQVAMFATISSLIFNLNPLVKLDGYYILSDLLGMPNLAGRASQAALAWVGRALGANMAEPARGPLVYWVLSYLYRWVIFAGIFWLAYQVDPRLAVPVFAVVIIMLVLRPFSRTLQFARSHGARFRRVVACVAGLAVLATLSAVPFRDRVLMDGQLSRYETTYLRAPEAALLRLDEAGLPVLSSLELAHAQKDLNLRKQLVENAARAVSGLRSAPEQARLQTDLEQLEEMQTNLIARAQTLRVDILEGDVWTPLAAETFDDAWVQTNTEILGAVSRPVTPFVMLWLDQRDFETGLLARDAAPLQVRMVHAPECEFAATIVQQEAQLALQNGAVQIRAQINQPRPDCVGDLPSGAGVVARKEARPKPLTERVWQQLRRALQDRLPVETLLDRDQRS